MAIARKLYAALPVAIIASIVLFPAEASAAQGSFEQELKKRLIQKGLDKRIYQDLFKRAMPPGTTRRRRRRASPS